MRRTHVLLASAVAITGAAALLGNRPGRPTEVRGAPIESAVDSPIQLPGPASVPKSPAEAASPPATTVAKPPAVAAATTAALGDLLDLDHLALAPGGDHYEAVLRDGRHAVLTLDPALQSYAEKLLQEARAPRGAIVAMAPDGRILALAGRRAEERSKTPPAFDWRIATEIWAPAASVFKLV